jgi:hypothetical protein
VSNLYLNFSVRMDDPKFLQQVQELAQRGAHIYIAAGNMDANGMAARLKPHPNIHIIGASAGVIGGPPSTKLATLRVDNITEIQNGVIDPVQVDGGIDINRDGRPDVSTQLLQPIPFDARGQLLNDVDISARLPNVTIDDVFQITKKFSAAPKNAVASVGALRRHGLIDSDLLDQMKELTGLDKRQLDRVFVHVHHLAAYMDSSGGLGGIVLYRLSWAGRLDLLRQQPSNGPASSWATPNQLSEDVNAAKM